MLAEAAAKPRVVYHRRRPEKTALYEVVRDNLETLYGAIEDGALGVKLGKHARKELEGFLDCGLLCRGFARLRCGGCNESRLVAFACKGRGFCPSCLGRRMCATAATLIEDVLPVVPLRQWVLTFPFGWRLRLAQDGELLSALTRRFVDTVLGLYAKKVGADAKSGAVTVVQRTSSDLRVNPHLHVVFLDGAYREEAGELAWRALGHLRTSDVAEVLEAAVRRIERYLRRRGLLFDETAEDAVEPLTASAVTGRAPPCGPEFRRGLRPLTPSPLRYEKPLCASLDGFTLHAATTAGAADLEGREALLRYVLRPPLANDRVQPAERGLVRIALKRPFADGTTAIELDPLSLLCRLAASVPPPRFHTVKYAGVLAPASRWRKRIVPRPKETTTEREHDDAPKRRGSYWPWALLLARTFELDVLECPTCHGRMRLVALVTKEDEVRRFLAALDEDLDVPTRSPCRGPPYWRSTILRKKSLGDVA